MSCVRPLTAYWRDVNRSAMTFDRVQSATKVGFNVPCGKCIGCYLKDAYQWGMRCMHERKMWSRSCYVTLTYEDEYLPVGNTLVVRDLQLFLKRLRKARNSCVDNPVRFFASGEYGDERKRPHYHLLLFNCDFPDMKFLKRNFRGDALYCSEELRELWFQGFNTIGEVTYDSAVYCAKYAIKRKLAGVSRRPVERVTEDGEVYLYQPEFANMSRDPGIGRTYYDKYGSEIRALDNVIVDGREVAPPRYYDDLGSKLEPERMFVHKARRKRLAVLNRSDNTEERLRVKEKLMLIAADKKERKL